MNGIDEMLAGYLACAIWTGHDWQDDGSEPESLEENYDVDDIAAGTVTEIRNEISEFVAYNSDDLIKSGGTWEQHGHDFCLTRNGHGAGFWDRGYGDIGDRLTAACRPYGTSELYVGDDGELYVQG